ncbi:MAG: DNA methyltransferase [candidate division WOR-3 bacterium]
MSDLRRIVEELVENFSEETLRTFVFHKFPRFNFEPADYTDLSNEKFKDIKWLGYTKLDDGTKFCIVTCEVKDELTERTSKVAQFDLAKKILFASHIDAGFFIFHDGNQNFRFSLVHSIYKGTKREYSPYKRYTHFIEKGKPCHTFKKSMLELMTNNLEQIISAFDIERVTEEFFEAYRYALTEKIVKNLDNKIEESKRFSFAQLLLSRVLFVYFLQKKGWLKWKDYEKDKNYLRTFWQKYKAFVASNPSLKNTFYSEWLSSLFFGAFNKLTSQISQELPEDIRESLTQMPFLNGGLFSKTELDELILMVPDEVFEWLFEPDPLAKDRKKGFLELFNFTIEESMPLDVEVAVDPEMLGKVYESLINDEERGKIGIFYTPRTEIDLMCKLSLIEYLASQTTIPKEKIIEFVFNPSEKIKLLSKDELSKIKYFLEKVKIVDPSVGSASFLVGMMNILVDLHSNITRLLEGKEENIFALKEKIIKENLYGVDVKDWAVMVAELRLWLSLIIETEEKYMDIYSKPLLPNLSFKIRQGDSLVEEIGGIQISLRAETKQYLPQNVEEKLRKLIDKKNAFFSGQLRADLQEIQDIEDLEHSIFTEILESKINMLSKEIEKLENLKKQYSDRRDVFGSEDRKAKEKVKELKVRIEEITREKNKYEACLTDLKSKSKKDYFLWEVDFAEVFAGNGGFDIVIGNPPYVRQELIAPPLENKEKYDDDEWEKLKTDYKEKLIKSVVNIWPGVNKVDKKSDLYVYFYYHGLSLLRKGGIFCFINSNSWLDVGYGAGLQEFLLKNMKPIYIIDNLKKRSFKEADVNTIIVLIQRPQEKLEDYTVKFIAFKKPFEEVVNAELIKKIEEVNQPVFDDEDFRVFPKTKRELLIEGVEFNDEEINLKTDPEFCHYKGNKWGGKYLRAPEIYFKILEKGKGKLVRLGDIAEVKRGFTTGANEFFYLKPVGMTVKEVVKLAEENPAASIHVKNDAGWEGEIEAEFLKPVIKSPREIRTIIVKLEDLNYLIFMCHKSKGELEGTKALAYIGWGEKQGFNKRPTCRVRPRWWDLREQKIRSFLWPRTHNDSHRAYESLFYAADNFSMIYPKSEYDNEIFGALLNSTWVWFGKELHGRKVLGEGGLSSLGVDLVKIEVVDPIFIKNDIKGSFSDLKTREIFPIFTELGLDPNKPIREQEPNPLPDRKALDDVVFDALGLTEDERKEVYWAVAELVKNRLEKAKSI